MNDLSAPEDLVTCSPDIQADEIPLFLKGRISDQELLQRRFSDSKISDGSATVRFLRGRSFS